MKRSLNVFDGLFLMAVYFFITEQHLHWIVLLIPYILEYVLSVLLLLFEASRLNEKVYSLRLALVRKIIEDKVKKNAAETKAKVDKIYNRPANPGKYVDPRNIGK